MSFYLSLDLKTLRNLQFIEKTSTVNSIPLIVKNFVKKQANAIDVIFTGVTKILLDNL